jgi:hypothetical protein
MPVELRTAGRSGAMANTMIPTTTSISVSVNARRPARKENIKHLDRKRMRRIKDRAIEKTGSNQKRPVQKRAEAIGEMSVDSPGGPALILREIRRIGKHAVILEMPK